jgi:hypothetical protein
MVGDEGIKSSKPCKILFIKHITNSKNVQNIKNKG